ncbi:universal stress protein [uncultured Tateyamaria sp.]|uniref:universal stress protein n=1 Tax=uncultured Tateyamaria sp. TaxID=455651 RepID=UPI002605C0DF|nr:universal stress protein [uncultured Tateyamaria sp.]
MYSNILIPVAFDSEKDLSGAIDIAKRIAADGASITFLHVMEQVPVYVTDYIPDNVLAETREAARAKLNELVGDVDNSRAVVIDGPTGRSITNWSEQTEVDCIVIPSHQPVISDILLGSTAAWVVRHAHCAVHVIR